MSIIAFHKKRYQRVIYFIALVRKALLKASVKIYVYYIIAFLKGKCYYKYESDIFNSTLEKVLLN
jgi:hypothetical protein